jgi:AraC-like DNA-binding protein
MFLSFEDRPSDSPLVERIWRCQSSRAGLFSSVAANHWEMVVTRLNGEATLTVRGPETRATLALAPGDGEWLGIRFRFGTFMPQLPVARLLDRQDVTLPQATKRTFWLDGSAWEYPSFENAEAFVRGLVRGGRIGREPVVDDVVRGRRLALSTRSAQRRFVRATGLTYGAFRRTERARHAANLLRRGVPIADVVHDAGYFDQPHLTRSLKRLMGLTPGQLVSGGQQLSFLYKTTPA